MAWSPSTTSATSGPEVMNVAQRRVEVALEVLAVVPVGLLAVDLAQLHRDQREPLALDPGQHLAHQAAADGVGLDQDERALGHERAPGGRGRTA